MNVSVGGVPVDALSGNPARPGTGRRTRRDVLRGLFGAAAALVPAVAASRSPQTGAERAGGSGAGPGAGSGFEENYRGRRLHGVLTSPGARTAKAGTWQVTVDGRPLHLMRRADGTWLSMVDHYRSYPTPLAAARAAVDELGPRRQLRTADPVASGGGHPHMGGDHGVHA
ncbi:tyrosinase family oxidase copper chaperone [Streptomyces sp. NPDC005423]|uniref:tyrosinase family oxidase copper chaperone n=1 Tax=Streptomyces sp. NPDC005423 TaxID=3155343 RepID=UPI0033A345E2